MESKEKDKDQESIQSSTKTFSTLVLPILNILLQRATHV